MDPRPTTGSASDSAALGLKAHSGWAVLVAVAGAASAPTLVERRRIELASATPAQPYHRGAELHDVAAAAAWIERALDEACARARAAVRESIAAIERQGYRVRRAAVLANRARVLPALEAILASHPLLHTAEGELFRTALGSACGHHGLIVARVPERDVSEHAARCLTIAPARLLKQVEAIRRSVGPPWTADHKAAFLAAWSVLAR